MITVLKIALYPLMAAAAACEINGDWLAAWPLWIAFLAVALSLACYRWLEMVARWKREDEKLGIR